MLITNNKINNFQVSLPKQKKYNAHFAYFPENNHSLSKLSLENYQAYVLSFKKSTTNNKEINWDEIGWDNLKHEPIDWTKADKAYVKNFLEKIVWNETKDNESVSKYNPENTTGPLALYPTLASLESEKNFKDEQDELNLIASGKDKPEYLDKPVINPKTGKFNVNLVIFDTETTGKETDPNKGPVDKIIQIGALKINSNGKILGDKELSQFINPEMHISKEAKDKHHISDDDVKDKPVIKKLLKKFVNDYIGDDLIVAYNSKFDIAMLNNAIDDYNKDDKNSEKLTGRKHCLTLDPFIILQRIHPYLGASKRLGEQYKYLFGQDLEGAHDALIDVKATAKALEYCCKYLNKNYKKKGSLTVKDVLTFQLGGIVPGLDILLDDDGCDATKVFENSYQKKYYVDVKNFVLGYTIPKSLDPDLKTKIGDNNAKIFTNIKITNKKGYKKNYFIKLLKTYDFEKYKDKSRDEIIQLLADASVVKGDSHEKFWIKNIKEEEGNDLPDIEILLDVMKQAKDDKNSEGRELEKVLDDK